MTTDSNTKEHIEFWTPDRKLYDSKGVLDCAFKKALKRFRQNALVGDISRVIQDVAYYRMNWRYDWGDEHHEQGTKEVFTAKDVWHITALLIDMIELYHDLEGVDLEKADPGLLANLDQLFKEYMYTELSRTAMLLDTAFSTTMVYANLKDNRQYDIWEDLDNFSTTHNVIHAVLCTAMVLIDKDNHSRYTIGTHEAISKD